jgi:tetratricopeptide (TPR) repeat protein
VHQSAYAEALKHFEWAVVLAQRAENKRMEANVLNHMSLIYSDLSDPQAHHLNQRALEISREIGDKSGEAIGLTNLGNYYEAQGDRVQAMECYAQALQTQQQIGLQSGEAITLFNIGYLYERLGDYDEAFDTMREAANIVEKVGNRNLQVATLGGLASVCFSQRRFDESREYAAQAIQLGETLGNNRFLIPAQVVLGHALISLKLLDEAEATLRAAQTNCDQTGYTQVMADLLNGLARLAMSRGDRAQALTEVGKILELRRMDPTLVNMSDEPMRVFSTCYVVLQTNQDSRALEILQDAYTQLEAYAGKITNPKLRKMFLEQVPANREILALGRSQNL